MRACLVLVLAALSGCAPTGSDLPDAELVFRRDGHDVARLSFRELARFAPPTVVATDDPYYGRRKRFRAMALTPILEHAFHERIDALRRDSFVLRATDGYAVPIEGFRLLEAGAYVAYDDADVPGFSPIGPRRVSPAPAYLVWANAGQSNLETHPRPWQLRTIEIARFESLFPHTVPTGAAPESGAARGFAIFRERCIRCHAINREGGRVGPDLNVPRSIVEYRPEAQIRAYIRDPRTFRYGEMPAQPDLSEGDLDALLDYLRSMAALKFDPHDAADREPE